MIRGVPYDAEVEYLESTGTQWIDTGVAINCRTDTVDCRVKVTSVKNYGTAFAVYESIDGSGKNFGVRRDGTQASWQALWGSLPQTLVLDTVYDIHYGYGANACYINDMTGSSSVTTEFTKPLYIFAFNNLNGANLFNAQCLYSFSISRNGVPVRDFIPVRFTNELGQSEGAMYDRVTRRLFRNQGAGAFQWGPDVATPVMALHMFQKPPYTAKDYIQKGLVTLWDGRENAGWGVHDPNATTWVDLSGNGRSLPIPTAWQWSDKAAIANNQSTLVRRSADDLEAMKNGYTIEVVVKAYANESTPYPSGAIVGIGEGCSIALHGNMAGVYFTNHNQYNGYGSTASWRHYSFSVPTQSPVSFAMVCNIANGTTCFVNGRQTYSTPNAGITGDQYPGKVGFGVNSAAGYQSAVGASQGLALGGEYYRTGVYNRALTAAEIAHNYAVDKERFKLP